MKQTKKPTAAQKKIIARHGLDPMEWRVIKMDSEEIVIQEKILGTVRHLVLNK